MTVHRGAGMELTRTFAHRLVEMAADPLAPEVDTATRRTLLNVIGTAIGASRHPYVEQTVAVGRDLGGEPVAVVPGRTARLDPWWAAIATGLAAHLDDYDDTHLATVIHPGAATLGAVLGASALDPPTGARFLRAFAVGCEAQLRLGLAISPRHYDEGWHITGTCGVMGAAVAAGLVMGLDGDVLATALGIAASETLGTREGFGTTIKSFHPGKAGANGVLAARLAAEGFTSSTGVLEAPRGYFRVLSSRHDPTPVLEGLGTSWELLRNTFKPYPCGIVSHPALDAAVALAARVDAEQIQECVVSCHPLVAELTGNPSPTTGLEARFSTVHGVAAGLTDGVVGLPQYTDERVADPALATLRGRLRLSPDDAVARDEARVVVSLRDGTTVVEHVEHARGSLARPLGQEDLERKVAALVEPVMPGATLSVVAAVDALEGDPTVADLYAAIGGGSP